MKHLTRYTRSFIFVLILSLGAAYTALLMVSFQKDNIPDYGTRLNESSKSKNVEQTQPEDIFMPTDDWKTFQDAKFPISFKYPPGWTVSDNIDVSNFHTITAISKKKDKISIYINDTDYFAMNGLNTKPYTINGYSGFRWNDSIVAFKAGKYHYTFDSSQNTKPIPEFITIISTVKLVN